MGVPRVGVVLILVFLLDTAVGAVWFTIFRWIGDQNPPAEALQLGLVGAWGSLVFMLVCLYVARLGDHLRGLRMPILGIAISMVAVVLLTVNRSVWGMYVLWPLLFSSWSLIFPSITGWVRYGRSGKSLRKGLLVFCIAWMSGMTVGSFFGSWLYGLYSPDVGARNVYLSCICIYLLSLLVMWLFGRKPRSVEQATRRQHHEAVDPNLARAFVRVGWLGNIVLMVCGTVLFNLFNKLATDLGIPPVAHGRLVVMFRIGALVTAGLMVLSLFWHYHWWGFLLAQGMAVVGLCIVGMSHDYWLFVLGFVFCGIMMGHNYYAGVYYRATCKTLRNATEQPCR